VSETSAERLPARFDQRSNVEFPDQDGRGGSVVLRSDETAWNRTRPTASWEPLLELPYDALAHSLTTMRDATAALIFEAEKDRQRVLDLEAEIDGLKATFADLERMLRVSREDAARLREQVRELRHKDDAR
jgi:hypothetical protein